MPHELSPAQEALCLTVARGAIAALKREDDAHHTAALVLSGAWDDQTEVRLARIGARNLLLYLLDVNLVGEIR